jgi:Na+/melibiose symporter-like transporter
LQQTEDDLFGYKVLYGVLVLIWRRTAYMHRHHRHQEDSSSSPGASANLHLCGLPLSNLQWMLLLLLLLLLLLVKVVFFAYWRLCRTSFPLVHITGKNG